MTTYVSTRSGQGVYIIIAFLAGIYLVLNLALPRFDISEVVETYVLQPIMWGLLAWAVLALFPKYRPVAKPKLRSSILQLAIVIGFFQVMLYVIGGFFSSFGQSPYSFTPIGIMVNIIFVAAMLMGMELSRAWLINHLGKKHTFTALAFVALLYTLLTISLTQITDLSLELESISFLNSTFLPLLAENLLASFLALLAGPLPAIAYRGILQVFWWFCPILPDLPWMFKGLFGTALPIIGMIGLNMFYSAQANRGKPRKQAKEGFPTGWIITTIAAVAIIWFSVGLFPFHPALVGSGSMMPTMAAGDVVLIAKVSDDVIKTGDVIQFRVPENITIMHRVIEIQETEGGAKSFITQGDANSEPDSEPVIPENLVGKAVLTIPKIGWASIAVKQFFSG
jgi:signal peptidase